jgi:hypothetical protein
MIFEALESIFEVGFEFFGVFRLGLVGNEESRRKWFRWKWWVMTGSAVVGEVREKKEEKKKKKTRGVREGEAECFVLFLSLCIFS